MDEIFQWLIWLFIIISFFASFFKKKNEPGKPQAPQQRPNQQRPTQQRQERFPVKTQSGSDIDKEEYDILREIESLFKTDTSQPTRMEQKESGWKGADRTASEHASYEGTRRENEYVSYETGRTPSETQKMDTSRSMGESTLTSSEHSFEPAYKKKPKKPAQVDQAISSQADAFEKFLLQKNKEGINFASVINNRLKEPTSLKEYVIISEILRRPSHRYGRYRTALR